MGCNCRKRGALLAVAAKRAMQNKPVAPVIRAIKSTIVQDARTIRPNIFRSKGR